MAKLKASTLVEVLTAMVLIAIATSIGVMVFTGLSSMNNNTSLYKANYIIAMSMRDTVSLNLDEEIIYKDERIEVVRSFEQLEKSKTHTLVSYKVKNNKGVILRRYKKIQAVL